jgi:hypothetical protein
VSSIEAVGFHVDVKKSFRVPGESPKRGGSIAGGARDAEKIEDRKCEIL